jgi:hypothetical protein
VKKETFGKYFSNREKNETFGKHFSNRLNRERATKVSAFQKNPEEINR